VSRGSRVVFDTSTLVSAVLRPSSTPERALLLALSRGVVCACEETLEELRSVLSRGKFDRYAGKRARMEFIAIFRRNVLIHPLTTTELTSVRPSCRDRRDNVFLALAASAQADTIVSSDEDLLSCHPWRGIAIVTPSVFMTWYDPS
jgi:putative PIN family toxin of toxin-antitoxin system